MLHSQRPLEKKEPLWVTKGKSKAKPASAGHMTPLDVERIHAMQEAQKRERLIQALRSTKVPEQKITEIISMRQKALKSRKPKDAVAAWEAYLAELKKYGLNEVRQ